MTQGVFTNNDPRATTQCGTDLPYQETGPVQLAASGTYYYADILIERNFDICLQVYTQPFDPVNPQNNRVGALDVQFNATHHFPEFRDVLKTIAIHHFIDFDRGRFIRGRGPAIHEERAQRQGA